MVLSHLLKQPTVVTQASLATLQAATSMNFVPSGRTLTHWLFRPLTGRTSIDHFSHHSRAIFPQVANAKESLYQLRSCLEPSRVYCLLFVLVAFGVACGASSLAIAVYAVSFWHYYLYWLAYRFGSVPLSTFKWDAVFMKTIALIGFGWVYAASPLHVVSLALVLSGFMLNTLAAKALGSDRTYYGYEVAGLSHEKVTAFPYSWVSHPMLIGNVAAFGGSLINADFRAKWWPLASAHVLFNIGLLVMETLTGPARPTHARRQILFLVFATIGLGIALGFWMTDQSSALVGGVLGASVYIYAILIDRCYTSPASDLCKSLEININNTP